MILEIKNRYDFTLLEFVMEFKLQEEFKKQFETPIEEWDGDMYDGDVMETLLETYRPENNYVIWDKYIDPKLSDEDCLDDILSEQESFIESSIRLKQILISVMYTVNNPEVLNDIQEVMIKVAMKHEIKNNNPPDDVVDNFLDYMNQTTKSY